MSETELQNKINDNENEIDRRENDKIENEKNENEKAENEKNVLKNEKKSIYTLICLGVIIFILIIIISTIVASSGKEVFNIIFDNSDFVIINDKIPNILTELRYYTSYNFIGEKIVGYEEPVAIIRKEVIDKLREANNDFNDDGYLIKIWDSYRPQKSVAQFYEWVNNNDDDTKMEKYFYPNLTKSDLKDKYINETSDHSLGYSIDLTLVNMTTGKEIDFGSGFDFFNNKSITDNDEITDEQNEMREYLKATMEKYNFENNGIEWYHYTFKDNTTYIFYNFTINATKIKNKIFE